MFFYGEEDFLVETAVKSVIDEIVPSSDRDFNLKKCYADEADSLADALYSPPLFGSLHVTLVRQAQNLKNKPLNVALKFMESPAPGSYLILWAEGKPDLRKRIFKVKNKNIDPIEFKKLTTRDLERWIKSYTKSLKKELDDTAIARICSINWPTLRELAHEIDQLALLFYEKSKISSEDISELGNKAFGFKRWELGDVIGNADNKKFHQIVESLLISKENKLAPTQIIGDIFRIVSNLLIIKSFQRKNKLSIANSKIRLHNFVFKKYCGYIKNFDYTGMENAILMLHQADFKIKSGLSTDKIELSIIVNSLINKMKNGK